MEFKSKSRQADDLLLRSNRQERSAQQSLGPDLSYRQPSLLPNPHVTPKQLHLQRSEQQLTDFTVSPVTAQRQALAPMFEGLQLQRDALDLEGPVTHRQHLQRQIEDHQASLGAGQLQAGQYQAAVQRQADLQTPVAPLTQRPSTPSEWSQGGQWEVQRVAHPSKAGYTISLREHEQAQHLGVLRTVGTQLGQGFRTDAGPAAQRYEQYGEALAPFGRLGTGTGRAVVTTALMQVPVSQRQALQRAIDEVIQRQQIQEDQDRAIIQLHSLQRQLEHLDGHSKQPVMEQIQARRGAGNPLPAPLRKALELELNHDLGAVRIHDDAEADTLAKKVNAVAFTTGQDVFFRAGTFNPNTRTGVELIAHEVTHTVQQAQGRAKPGIDGDAGQESEARSFGVGFASRVVPTSLASSTRRLPSTAPKTARASVSLASGVQRFSAVAPLSLGHAIQRQVQQTVTGEAIGKRAFVREEGLNLREQPDQHAQSLGIFPIGAQVMVAARSGEWFRVLTGTGRAGYMLASKIYGLDTKHQAMLQKDPGLRLFRVKPGETGMQLVKRAYGITGAEGGRDQNLWHFLNVIRRDNQAAAFGSRDLGWWDARQNAVVPGADANNVLLKANTDLWIPSFTVAAQDRSVGSGTLRGEAVRLGKNVAQKVMDFQAAKAYCDTVIGPIFSKRLGEGAHELISGLLTSMLAAAGVLVGTSAIGAIIGAFAGGVGAAPGAAIGFQIGTWLLEWLGLGFLVVWGGQKLLQVFSALGHFVSSVWTANGNQEQIKQAGVALADALAVTAVTALQVLVTIGIAKGLGAATKGLANSRFGQSIGVPRLTAYLEGKIGAINKTAASTPKTARIQVKLAKTTPQAVLGPVIRRVFNTTKAQKGFKSTAEELTALKAGKETVDVYTTGKLPENGPPRWAALERPESWKPSRQALHRELIARAKLQSKAFAEAAKGAPPTVYAMRGNTAAGKSRAVKGNIPQLEGPVNATPNMPHRAINPDNFKNDLYRAQPEVPLTSAQVHSESSALASMLEKELLDLRTSDGKMGSLLIDKRLASLRDVIDYASIAQNTGRKLNMYDIDAPLEVSLAGVLERVPGGDSPLPPFDIVAGGFRGIRSNRLAVIDYFIAHEGLGKYELFGTTAAGAKLKVAEVFGGELKIYDQKMYSEITSFDAELSTQIGQMKITNELISTLTSKLSPERAAQVRGTLEPWKGKTWQEALDLHSAAKKK